MKPLGTSEEEIPLFTSRQWRMMAYGLALLHETEKAKPEAERRFALDEIETVHHAVYGHWIDTCP